MMKFNDVVLLICVASMMTSSVVETLIPEPLCPKRELTRNQSLAFTDNPLGNLKFVCPGGTSAHLSCCIAGYDRIEWDVYNARTSAWDNLEEYMKRTHHFWTEEEGQVLGIKNPTSEDEGSYRCRGYNQTWEITHAIQLKFEECGPGTPPSLITRNVTEEAYIGNTIVKSCSAFFGDYEDPSNFVHWDRIIFLDNGSVNYEEINDQGRIFVTESTRDGDNPGVAISLLSINHIQPDDFRWNYQCSAWGEVLTNKFAYLTINRKYPIIEQEWKVPVGVCAVIVAVLVSALIATVTHITEIRILWMTRKWCRTTRKGRLAEPLHDIVLLGTHNRAEEKTFLDSLDKYLSDDLHYKLFTERHVNYGESSMNRFMNAIGQCSVVVVVVTEDLLHNNDNDDNNIYTMCIREIMTNHHGVIYVLRERMNTSTTDTIDIYTAMKQAKRVEWYTNENEDEREGGCRRNLVCSRRQSPEDCKKKLQLHILTSLERGGLQWVEHGDVAPPETSCMCFGMKTHRSAYRPVKDRQSDTSLIENSVNGQSV